MPTWILRFLTGKQENAVAIMHKSHSLKPFLKSV